MVSLSTQPDDRPGLSPQKRKTRHTLVLILNLLLVLSLACSFPSLFGGEKQATPTAVIQPSATPSVPTPTPQPMPPALVEVDPPPGAELPLKGPLTLYFNQPMERSSVEAALAKSNTLNAQVTWVDDATLKLSPSQPLAPESLINLSFGTDVRSTNGLALVQPVDLTFQAAGFLRLAQRLPEPDASEVDPTSAVVASFNRPVVALGADPAGLPAGFSLEPAAEGRGEWLNTSTYIFYPEPSLDGGKQYTVQVNSDLQSTEGSPLENSEGWSFTTAEPRLVSFEAVTPLPAQTGVIQNPNPQPPAPQNNSAVRLDAVFVMTFNQPMDPASVEANFRLLGPGGAPVAGSIEWSEENTVGTFKPAGLLEHDTAYQAVLDAQVQSRGGTPIGEESSIDLHTVPALSVTRSDPAEGGQKQTFAPVILYFSAPILDKDTQQQIQITPKITNLYTWWDESQLALNISGDFQPSTSYSLSLSPDLSDPWGGKISQPYTLNFSTTPLDPFIGVTGGSDILYLTPKDTALAAQAANLTNLPITRGSIPLEDFIKMLSPDGYDLRNTYHSKDEVSWTEPLNLALNKAQPVALPVSPGGAPLAPGLYYFRYTIPGQNAYGGPFFVVVSPIQVTYKLSATDALVWATDLTTGKPAAGISIALYDEKGNQTASGSTNEEGIYQASISPREEPYNLSYAVIGQPGEDNFSLALSSWNMSVSPWDFGLNYNPQPPHLQAYIYTDRPIYRPGQTVNFRVVARQAYNGRYSLPQDQSIQLKVYGSVGNELDTLEVPLSAFGTGHGQYFLTPDAPPGNYSLGPPNDRYGSTLSFQVADYRKPEINLQVSFPTEQVKAGEMISSTVNARYFFDAPAGNLPVSWALYENLSNFELPGYQVGPADTGWLDLYPARFFGNDLGWQVLTGEGKTDPQGLLNLELPTTFDETLTPLKPSDRRKLTLEVTIQDESGLPVSARAKTDINPAEIYIGLRPDTWVVQAGQQAGYDVQVVDWSGNPAGSHALRAEFKKVTWVREEAVVPYMGPKYTPQYEPVASTDFVTNEDGQARIAFTPDEPGTYQLDVSGEGSLTGFIQWVGGPGQVVWPNLPNQRLRLVPDRQQYQPGDTAQVFVPNPFGRSLPVLMTVERSVTLSYKTFTLEPTGSTLSIPLSTEEAPNVFISVTILDPGNGQPDFRQGYTELKVQPVEQTLNVALTSTPQRAGPGDEVTFDIQVTDAAGQPVQGEFSLAVVDLAALALADPNSKEIVPTFYGEQPLGVQTGSSLAVYANRGLNVPAGGGGGGGEAIVSVARENFPDTAYWNAEVVTDANGIATVTVPLPDTLTTWQVDMRGVTTDTRVGEAQSQVVTSKDLLVRPVTPRFLVTGDRAQLAAVVQNNTGNPLQADVSLQASGFTLEDPASAAQTVSIPANGRARVEWWGTADDVDHVDLVFSASAGGLQDLTRPAQGSLPVLHYTAPQTFATSGILDEGDSRQELISLPRSFDPQGGSLDVELAPSLSTAMLNALEALENFPYDCTEQTVSRFLPNLETYRVLKEFGIDSPELEARLERTLEQGLQRLMSRQNMDGGWGWWIDETESDPYTSAYVVYGLLRAQQAGSSINRDALQRAVDYLHSGLTSPATINETWQLDRLVFENYVLTQAAEAGFGSKDQSMADALYERRTELNPWSKALLALTYESLAPGSETARTLISDLEGQAVRTATGAHWEEAQGKGNQGKPLPLALTGGPNRMTTISTTAISLYALARQDPGTPLVAEAVRYLTANRGSDGAWESTYSTAWSLMALSEVMRGTGELGGDFTFSAALNGAPVASGQASPAGASVAPPVMASVPLSSLYPDNPNALTIQRGPGNGRLYYTADLRVFRPVETVAPLDRGITLSRSYELEGEACTPENCPAVTSAQSGQRVKVRLTLTVPNDSYYLMVEDYIPAGTEILNKTLKTSQQGENVPPEEQQPPAPQYDARQPYEQGWGWWLFQDPQVYDDHVAWAANYLPAGTYELTYTLTVLQPGQYRVLPARAWEFYFPEVQGNSAGEVFEVTP